LNIRRILITLLALTGLVTAFGSTAGDADFLLVNRTGYAIREIYLTPTHKKKWGPERLGKRVLGNGQQREFKLGNFADCVQDMLIVFDDDGSEVVWEEFDLCELDKITLRYNRRTGEVRADTE
jgi:hypothetical protein